MNIFGIDEFPVSPDEIDLQIKLYTRQNRDKPNIFMYNDISNLNISNFNESRNTKMIVHGFGGSCDKPWVRLMKDAFLNKELNVFCADWSKGAIHPYYSQAAANTQIVGKMVTFFLELLNEEFGSINERLHLIGFSLGAHICGFVGSELQGLSRITGLDPAGPIFTKLTASKKLDKSDADFVDIIHSNGKPFTRGGLGDIEASGTLDFYPNGGQTQLGCPGFIVAQLSNMFKWFTGKKRKDRTCNHRRAVEIFIESIEESCEMKAFPCSDWKSFSIGQCFDTKQALSIGFPSHSWSNQSGNYYFGTRGTKPFCGRQLRITIDYGTEYGYNSLYKGSVTMIFEDVALNNIDNFKILKHFYAPGRDSRVITIEKDFPIEDIYLSYNQNGYGFFINVIKSRKYLRINSVEITDDISGSTSIWALNTTNNVIESGAEEKLFRIPK
ncbi:inactive pancreatic lipase-related protein 1 isoform X2 [Lepeophtheirus salmonis]|nr:inactive pancreatic lipase-related protein 1-like [Lepeophtheirus salmonis]XP_040572497.1 inactive pancreatic lipase-related protein 1-like [Lepeophtheirus salmonis]